MGELLTVRHAVGTGEDELDLAQRGIVGIGMLGPQSESRFARGVPRKEGGMSGMGEHDLPDYGHLLPLGYQSATFL